MKLNNNKIIIGNKEITFDLNIDTILYFSECVVILLMDRIQLVDNNVEAYDYGGNKLWNISEIIDGYPDAYIFIKKGGKDQLVTQSYYGVRFTIDLKLRKILRIEVTK